MKKNYRVLKIGNSYFATLPKDIVKYFQLTSGDTVTYEILQGKNKLGISFSSKSNLESSDNLLLRLSKEDQKWIHRIAGSLSIRK